MKPTLLAVSAFQPWPITNGYILRVAGLLEELVKQWEIALIAPASPEPERWDLEERFQARKTVELAHYGVLLTLDREGRGRVTRAVEDIARDLRPAACLLWPGTEFLSGESCLRIPALADRIDCLTLQNWRASRIARRVQDKLASLHAMSTWALQERRIVRGSGATTVVGEADAAVLRRLAPGSADRVFVVPNGVDVKELDHLSNIADRPTVTFTGVLAYGPNVEAVKHFVDRVWPRVLREEPQARFVIAGRNPGPDILQLAQRPGVDVQADVADMNRVLRAAWVCTAPMLSGSGIKNKVLEAWAVGRPVVMYELAANGLDMGGPQADLVSGNPEAMASIILRLLRDPEELRRQAMAAHQAASSWTWAAAAHRISELLRQMMHRPGVPRERGVRRPGVGARGSERL